MPSTIDLCGLPSEILLSIGEHLPCRLGLPSDALNRHLVNHFRTASNIAARAIAYHQNPAKALRYEAARSEAGANAVIKALCSRIGREDINARSQRGHASLARRPLSAAAEAGNTEIVETLLNYGADIHAENEEALRVAVFEGHIPTVGLLLNMGANMHGDSVKILDWAAGTDRSEAHAVQVIDFLLNNGANIHSDGGREALHSAAVEGQVEIVRLLLERGVPVDADYNWALYDAAKKGHLEVVKVLLRSGADIHGYRDQALWCAVGAGQIDVVWYLLTHGANAGGDDKGYLEMAAVGGHEEVIKLIEQSRGGEHNK
ncbi:hypothetical protein HDU93_002111 [Gonapodya sp. JEL0774]|nr:hypothetical protein HDU93_002111 [Gonapodya sp. JEL0774]